MVWFLGNLWMTAWQDPIRNSGTMAICGTARTQIDEVFRAKYEGLDGLMSRINTQ